jgi:leucyl-tRNA synthetase
VEQGRVEKMSKSKRNIVDPEDLISFFGADTARLFTLFAAPPEKDLEWSDQGVEGAYRFLTRLWRFGLQHREWMARVGKPKPGGPSSELRELRRIIHRTIKKVSEDIEGRFHFNTAIAATMELFNAMSATAQDKALFEKGRELIKEAFETIVVLLAPFVPHITSELWQSLGHTGRVDEVPWPQFSEEALEEENLLIVVQINGKIRGKITVPAGATQESIEALALADAKVLSFLNGQKVVRTVYVPRRLLNIVLEE